MSQMEARQAFAPCTTAELEAGLDLVRRSPAAQGTVELIVRRPAVDERQVLTRAQLDRIVGLVGDTWNRRPSTRTPDATPHPDMQLNIINARFSALIARYDVGAARAAGAAGGAVNGRPDRRPLAGDQLHLDLDLSEANLPAGTRLRLGTAVIEITDQPHTGCAKFSARFGADALRFVNSPVGRALRLRGANARVVTDGIVSSGDPVTKLG
jgi:hypothetical protein